ncbi:MAG TPA: bifunctional serine/threonine-protein kinase/formylglycine-generating enzyme family protein [Kofleriaceae bacterium]|nr:bifunctional serine/threonine-protein kinase/formylglycine-generating enzyme family protein [Kofleriaceae bacterium]
MASRRPEGTALLIAAHGAFDVLDAAALTTLGRIGEALLATGAGWQIRRLAAKPGEPHAPDRVTLKQQLDELAGDPARTVMLVLVGSILMIGGEPALITGGRAREYPEDATLPLRWIRDRLRGARAEQLVAVVSARSDDGGDAASWLWSLTTHRAMHAVAVARSDDDAHAIVGTLLTALCGDALDPRTGTVTMASVSGYLARHTGAAVQSSDSSETLAQPPPLAGLWDVRRSQLSMRATRPRGTDHEDNLSGTVLPGRFRVDSVVARGTFGTVYRARQLAVERDVAVKVLHADIDPASDDGRLFVHEIRSVGRIDCANVVRIHQADITHDGRLFYAMELLDGRDLQIVGDAAPLPRARAVELVRQLLAGLGAAHDAGLVHADVKPANAIVVTRDGNERVVLVDFGLARLRAPDQTSESAGGTPAYMAPEQLHLGRVDARSDLFSAALVLVYLLTGWKRPNMSTVAPPLEGIADLDLRAVLERALELDPGKRYATARELSSALTGAAAPSGPHTASPAAPFRQLAPLTEDDRGRLYGREVDLAEITQHALYRRSVIYTAPSGTGKTSLLRAGLVPRLEALGVRPVYLRCRPDCAPALAAAIWSDAAPAADAHTLRAQAITAVAAGAATDSATTASTSTASTSGAATASSSSEPAAAPSIASAVASWHRQRGGKLVLILDQVEAALGDQGFVRDVLGFADWPAQADVAVVLCIREDHLARLLAPAQALDPGIPLVRLPPLGPAGARAAIIGPLTEARLTIAADLLDALLADLQRAASAIGPEMGWGTAPAVFPPHLQLACSVLYEELGPNDATLTLAHYKRLGGFDAIVGEHLERVLDSELADGSDQIARALFVALVTATHERAMRPESELIAMVGDVDRVTMVLEVLRSRGLLVRVRGDDGEPSWELAHDSLVPRVRAWIAARDLARRQAVELVRYHLRRSRADAPSLLSFRELRELRRHEDAIAELDAEWKRRTTDEPWTPSLLVARSRLMLRRQLSVLASLTCLLAIVAGVALYHNRVEARRRRLDLGRFILHLEPFDWDPTQQATKPVDPAKLALRWELHRFVGTDDHGDVVPEDEMVRGTPQVEGNALVEHVEAPGGKAFLVVARGPCKPSIVPLQHLPGYAKREADEARLHIRIPTCDATLAGTIAIPAGPFIYGGVGDPPSKAAAEDRDPVTREEQHIALPAYRIDRTEVTNAAYAELAAMAELTDIGAPVYPLVLTASHAGDPARPVSGINWHQAYAYCRYLGKQLPTSHQWVKAMRGGEQLPDGTPNPMPRRNLPWGVVGDPQRLAQLDVDDFASDVGSHPGDVSPYGVLDLTGNVREWTSSRGSVPGTRIVRGGSVLGGEGVDILDFMAPENARGESQALFDLGMRCTVSD